MRSICFLYVVSGLQAVLVWDKWLTALGDSGNGDLLIKVAAMPSMNDIACNVYTGNDK